VARKRVERNISYDDVRKKYYVNLDFGIDLETGKQIKKSQTFDKLTQARAALRKHEAARDVGLVVQPKETTVGQWLQFWMENVVHTNLAETTIYSYRKMIENHIEPELGSVPLQKLTPQRLQQYYTKKMHEGSISSNTVRKHHDLLKTAFRFAVKQGVLLANPTDRVEAPRVTQAEIHFYSEAELQKLLQLSENTRIEPLVKLAGLLGMRREEIMGLTWDCVDFDANRLHIASVRTAAGNEIVTKEPKTKNSRRTLYMPPLIVDVLMRTKDKQKYYRDLLGDAYQNNNYVLTHEDGRPIRPNYASELFKRFILDNDLPPLTLHGLRHSFASVANAKGVSLFDIGKALGHSSTATTGKIYTHLLDQDHRNMLEKMWSSEENNDSRE